MRVFRRASQRKEAKNFSSFECERKRKETKLCVRVFVCSVACVCALTVKKESFFFRESSFLATGPPPQSRRGGQEAVHPEEGSVSFRRPVSKWPPPGAGSRWFGVEAAGGRFCRSFVFCSAASNAIASCSGISPTLRQHPESSAGPFSAGICNSATTVSAGWQSTTTTTNSQKQLPKSTSNNNNLTNQPTNK